MTKINFIRNIDHKCRKIVRDIGILADKHHLSAYIVGGIVRDIVLQRKNLDLDIVVENDGQKLARSFAGKYNGRLTCYDQFLTATVQLKTGSRVDFSTARSEYYSKPGALPMVAKGTLKDDLFRRDFTINAMAISLNKNSFGQIVDYYDGIKDCQKQKIRILHNKSFIDDPTRILRAIRFEQRYKFTFDRKTQKLLNKAIQEKIVNTVRPPRYFNEFKKTLKEGNPCDALKRLNRFNGYDFIKSGFKPNMKVVSFVQKQIKKENQHMLRLNPERKWRLILFALFEGTKKDCLIKISHRFNLSKKDRVDLQDSLTAKNVYRKLKKKKNARSMVFQILKEFDQDVVLYFYFRATDQKIKKMIQRYVVHDRLVQLNITGEDIQKIRSISGQEIGTLFKKALMMKIDQKLKTKREEINFIKQSF